jgi:hypothetical protein
VTNPADASVTDKATRVFRDPATVGDHDDETIETLLRFEVLADERVRDLLWSLAAERPDPAIPPTSEGAREWGVNHQRYQLQLANLSKLSDGHFGTKQLDRLAERIRTRHPSCVEQKPTDLDESELLVLFAVSPPSDGWPSGKPNPRRHRGERIDLTVKHVVRSITARMTGEAQTWKDADTFAALEGDWHSLPETGRDVVRKYRERLRRRLPG